MTVKELKNAIADAMQTMKENRYTCTKAEKDIITAQNTKKADLENQLEMMQKVIERNEKRAAEKKVAEKAASLKKSTNTSKTTTAEKKTTAEKTADKKTPSTSKTSNKKTVDKPKKTEEQKKTWYPDKYETESNVFTKVQNYSAEAIENKDVLIGRYFDINAMTKKYVYSAKEYAIQRIMEKEKKAGRNPFPENIDLYEYTTMNDEVYIIQSLITTSFTSIRKDDLENAIKAGHVALYTMEEKKAPKKTTTKKTNTAKKTTAKKTIE